MANDKLILGLALLILFSSVNAQNHSNNSLKAHLDSVDAEIEKYGQIDYLNYQYKYLDEDLNITMPSEVFDSIIIANEIYRGRIRNYKDSIFVVISGEFINNTQRRLATLRITMSWLRVSYYLWLSEPETRMLGERYSFQFPYELYDYIYHHQDEWDDYMINFVEDLKNKIVKETGNQEIVDMNNSKLLSFALKNNPTRIRDFKRIKQ